MALKFIGERTIGALNGMRDGFVKDDLYRVYDAGILMPGGISVNHGDFVSWDGTKWKLETDIKIVNTSTLNPESVPESASGSNPLMTAEDTERMIDAMKPIDAMTLRFEFSKKDYNPETAGVGSAGTWAKVDSPTLNIWDWTNEETDWHESFKGAFPDADNEVRVIAAGDTSSVTTINGMFAGLFTGNIIGNVYSITARNNIVSCVPFDVSNCVDFELCFCATSLKEVVKFHYNNLLTYSGAIDGLFADSYVTEVDIDLYDISIKTTGLFARCSKLKKVLLKGVENLINVSSMCAYCRPELKEITIYGELTNATTLQALAQNSTNVTKIHLKAPKNNLNLQAAFNGCQKLTDFSIQLGKPSRVDYMFTACYELKEIPLIDTSSCSHAEYMMYNCRSAETIPDFDVSSVTNAKQMCMNMYKAKYGILEMYNKLLARGSAITDHTKCFKDCGRDTPQGRAALAQIPASWGGTGPEPTP